jgi:hypothetical protein
MLASGDLDPTSISNEQISALLTNLLAGRGSSGRDSTGQSFGGINDMSSYAEFRRLYAFLQNFDNAPGLDLAFVMDFFRYMDNHSDVSLTNISQSNIRLAGAGAVTGFLNDVSDEEAMFLFLSYVWATNSGRTYEQSRAMFNFGQAGAGIILGAAGAMATGAASLGATRGISHTTRRPPLQQRPSVWTHRGAPARYQWNTREEFNFSPYANAHMYESERVIPVQTLREAIRYGVSRPDPRGSVSRMYYITVYIERNGRKHLYNLEVLYDRSTNTIWHFEAARKAMGPLPEIPRVARTLQR